MHACLIRYLLSTTLRFLEIPSFLIQVVLTVVELDL